MKKQRHYFGRNKHNHRLGRVDGQWVVPRMLRLYFERKYYLLNASMQNKMSMNSAYGARVDGYGYGDHERSAPWPEPVKPRPEVMTVGIACRRELKAMYLSGSMPDVWKAEQLNASPHALRSVADAVYLMLVKSKLPQSTLYGQSGRRDHQDHVSSYMKAKWYYEYGECYPQIAMTLWGLASKLVEKLPMDFIQKWQTDPRVKEMLANAEEAIYEGIVGKLVPPAGDGKIAVIGGFGRGMSPQFWGDFDVLSFGQMAWTPELHGFTALYYEPRRFNWQIDQMERDFLSEDLTDSSAVISELHAGRFPANLVDMDVTLTYPGTVSLLDGKPIVALSDIHRQMVDFRGVPEHLQGTTALPVCRAVEGAEGQDSEPVLKLLSEWGHQPDNAFLKPIKGMEEGRLFNPEDPDYTMVSMKVDEETGQVVGRVIDHKGKLRGEPGKEYSLTDLTPVWPFTPPQSLSDVVERDLMSQLQVKGYREGSKKLDTEIDQGYLVSRPATRLEVQRDKDREIDDTQVNEKYHSINGLPDPEHVARVMVDQAMGKPLLGYVILLDEDGNPVCVKGDPHNGAEPKPEE